jgi:ATP-dependent DNA helicase RecG
MIPTEETAFMEWLAQPESFFFERKAEFPQQYQETFSKLICAFSNNLENTTMPAAYLVIGVNDLGDTLTGCRFTDEQERQLTELRNAGAILPWPRLQVEKRVLPEGDVLIISVSASETPPVRYKGTSYVRVGSTTRTASIEEERILMSRSNRLPFDARPCQGSSLNDILREWFALYRNRVISAEVLEENGRTITEQLAALRFFDFKTEQLTNVAVLLFASNPLYFMPGAYVQFVRFDGVDVTADAIERQEISGDFFSVVRTLEQLIEAHNTQRFLGQEGFRVNSKPLYPVAALRELLLNALVHRDYEVSNAPVRFYWFTNAIEIQNPGGLFGTVTEENYTVANDYRNPLLAEAAKVYGYVEKFGSGIAKVQKRLEKNGNSPASFSFEQNHVMVKLEAAL